MGRHSSSDEKAKCFLLFFSQPALPSCPVLLLRETTTTTRRVTPDSSLATTTSTRQSPGRPSGPEPPSWATRFSTRAAAAGKQELGKLGQHKQPVFGQQRGNERVARNHRRFHRRAGCKQCPGQSLWLI